MASNRPSITTTTESELPPDTEENVQEQAEGIVRNFMFQRFQQEFQQDNETPSVPELQGFTTNPLSSTCLTHTLGNSEKITPNVESPTAQVGRRLAQIGDDINARYSGEFRGMIRSLDITPSTAYEHFANIARKIFTDGINWGRIVALLMFGYRIAIDVIKKGFKSFFNSIVKFVVKFIIGERIAAWIARQGGWAAALYYQLEEPGWKAVGVVVAIAAVSIIACISIARR
ncbi:bcl-2 homologous antagonist/killer-like [Ptychodera flava]|uniref:bcl-2 homologous antagonist/killer-like n=1 Tax=Ptychodera flava TaxID=63121 RepID=UPI00396A063C